MEGLSKFMSSDKDGVFFIGHASALFRLSGKLILFDPVWDHKPYGDYWEFRPKQVSLDWVLDLVQACVISHIHEDHFCEPVIRRLAHHGCQFITMTGRPELHRRLISLGCEVIGMKPFEWTRRSNIEFLFVPHAFNLVDSSCFVRSEKYCVYHGNDNFLSRELIDKVKPFIGHLNVAMVPYAFIHWYPFCMDMPLDEKMAEIMRLNDQSLKQAEMFIEAFKPSHAIPCGSNLYHTTNDFLNAYLTNPNEIEGATPMTPGSYVIGDTSHIAPWTDIEDEHIQALKRKVAQAPLRVVDHQIIVNGLLIDLETLEVSTEKPTKDYTSFDFNPLEYKKWLSGDITFEQAIGTRQFRCSRVPDVYRVEVFHWFNTCL